MVGEGDSRAGAGPVQMTLEKGRRHDLGEERSQEAGEGKGLVVVTKAGVTSVQWESGRRQGPGDGTLTSHPKALLSMLREAIGGLGFGFAFGHDNQGWQKN